MRAGPVNYALAQRWFERAAEKGNVDAMLSLARIHREGLGIARNEELAKVWQSRAEKADTRWRHRRKAS